MKYYNNSDPSNKLPDFSVKDLLSITLKPSTVTAIASPKKIRRIVIPNLTILATTHSNSVVTILSTPKESRNLLSKLKEIAANPPLDFEHILQVKKNAQLIEERILKNEKIEINTSIKTITEFEMFCKSKQMSSSRQIILIDSLKSFTKQLNISEGMLISSLQLLKDEFNITFVLFSYVRKKTTNLSGKIESIKYIPVSFWRNSYIDSTVLLFTNQVEKQHHLYALIDKRQKYGGLLMPLGILGSSNTIDKLTLHSPSVYSEIMKAENQFSQYYTKLEKRNSRPKPIQLNTGIISIDHDFGGFSPNELILFVAEKGMGVTTMLNNILIENCEQWNRTSALFLYETTPTQIIHNLTTYFSGIEKRKIESGNLNDLEWQKLLQTNQGIARADIYFSYLELVFIEDIIEYLRAPIVTNGAMIYFDTLEHIKTKDATSKDVSRLQVVYSKLKYMAKEKGLIILIRSTIMPRRINREAVKPELKHLKSEELVMTDKIIGLYQPALDGILKDDIGHSTKGSCEFITLKNEDNILQTHFMQYDEHREIFTEWLPF